jgi:hypothetical protein
MTGLRRAQIRGFEKITVDEISSALAGAATPSAIDPDDAAVVGTSTLYARQDHQHANLAGAPDALERRTSNAEGTSGSFARADHDHATSALAWGIMARQTLTTSNGPHSTDATTDFALSSVAVLSTRLYKVVLDTEYAMVGTEPAEWSINFHVGGTLTEKLAAIREVAADARHTLHIEYLWEPSAATVNVDVRVTELSGTTTLAFFGAATNTRQFWIEDIGPR